jgi:hypothetical protein
MPGATLKIVFRSEDWRVSSSAEIEEPLDEMLIAAGVGEIISGGVGPTGVFFVVEVEDAATGLPVVREALRRLRVPESTRIEGLGGLVAIYGEER